jgi:prepilin-type N-terminal cleavage/methylation domain-containing protein
MNSSTCPRSRDGLAAFTLLELLVVIVIIAILAGLLLPVISSMRARADSAACSANLRQIGVAISAYVNENDNTLPGPLSSGQMPTYSTASTGSLAVALAKYLTLPAASATAVTAPIFLCPAYAKDYPKMDQPVYAADQITQAAPPVYPFGDQASNTPPLKLSALASLVDSAGNPLSSAGIIALRDYLHVSGTLVTTTVTFASKKPVHRDHLNALYFDWHAGVVDIATLKPK